MVVESFCYSVELAEVVVLYAGGAICKQGKHRREGERLRHGATWLSDEITCG